MTSQLPGSQTWAKDLRHQELSLCFNQVRAGSDLILRLGSRMWWCDWLPCWGRVGCWWWETPLIVLLHFLKWQKRYVFVWPYGGLPAQPPTFARVVPFFSHSDSHLLFIHPYPMTLPLCELQSHIDSSGHFFHNSVIGIITMCQFPLCLQVKWGIVIQVDECLHLSDWEEPKSVLCTLVPQRGGAEASFAWFMVCNCVLGRLCPLFLLLMAVCVLFLVADLCVGGVQGEALIYC